MAETGTFANRGSILVSSSKRQTLSLSNGNILQPLRIIDGLLSGDRRIQKDRNILDGRIVQLRERGEQLPHRRIADEPHLTNPVAYQCSLLRWRPVAEES